MTKGETAPVAASPPHYLGHRERLRDRFRKGGADALGEYELLIRYPMVLRC
jgi:DNA repair protein RadC